MYKRIAVLSVILAVLSASSASAISTYKSWDGKTGAAAFGCPNTATYGQVITVPAHRPYLTRFAFSLLNITWPQGVLVVRAEVYAWDGSKAAGTSLYESEPRTLAYVDNSFHKEVFYPTAVRVNPKSQYVIFLTVAKDYAQCSTAPFPGLYAMGAVDDATYAHGTFVFQNGGGNPEYWTTQPWPYLLHTHYDLAFSAEFLASP